VKDVEGDAYLNNRKGKIRLGFELKCKVEWKGQINDAEGKAVVECKGTAHLNDLDDTMDDDECMHSHMRSRSCTDVAQLSS
jgi:activator of HSP90 ATPase